MTQSKPKIRLHVAGAYTAGGKLLLGKNQSHYLTQVMRCQLGDAVAVFNGVDGEWLAEVASADKKETMLQLQKQIAAQSASPDLWLVFAPIKQKSELLVEKAVELGVSRMVAVFTRHGVVKSVNREKLEAHIVEAVEQCGRCDVPPLDECKDLAHLLGSWPKDRTLLYGDESGGGMPVKQLLQSLPAGKYALLIGPEGGFSAEEHQMLKIAPQVKAFTMGPRILRADTAAVAALACIQSWLGDWENKPSFTP